MLTYTGRKSLENQVANARLIVTKPQASIIIFYIFRLRHSNQKNMSRVAHIPEENLSKIKSRMQD